MNNYSEYEVTITDIVDAFIYGDYADFIEYYKKTIKSGKRYGGYINKYETRIKLRSISKRI